LYGTLVDIEVNEQQPPVWEALTSFLGRRGQQVEPEELKARFAYLCNKTGQQYGHGFILPLVFTQLLTVDRVSPTKDQVVEFAAIFRRTSILSLNLKPYTLELLTTLRTRSVRTAIVSNTESILTNVDLDDIGLRPYFDAIVLSSDLGLAKPNPRIVIAALRELGCGTNEAVFVGDTWGTDIIGARAAGLKAIFLEERDGWGINAESDIDILRAAPELSAILKALRFAATDV
jgi:putative hydrolase of the HAD superfamily